MTGRADIWTKEIHRRTQRYRQKYEKRILSFLAVFSLLLLSSIGALLQRVQTGGISCVEKGYSSVLLQEGAGGYIVIGLAAFTAGVVLTVICIRYNRKRSGRKPEPKEREEI